MTKTFEIGLVYINTNNIGDIVIFDCTKHLIEKSLKSLGVKDFRIVPIDMGERIAGRSDWPKSFAKSQSKKYAKSNKYIKEWKTSKLYYYFSQNELPKINGLDLIIFAGGGLIKFHEQYFHMYIDEITTIADKNHIPVIFNSVGAEGYKQNDLRCQILKKALNRRCVKAVSTRDNLSLLQDKYLDSRKARLVCDPALWVRETYGIKESKRNAVGLGVIRPEIFALYGVEAPREVLLSFFEIIITELENRGLKYKLFTNGGRRDYRFIEDIIVFMNRGEEFKKNIEPIPKSGKALAQMINGYSRIITCRMHGAVIAYALNVPAVSVVWNRKQKYFAELSKQPDNLIFNNKLEDRSYVMKKILASYAPGMDNDYKFTDYDFINQQVKKHYRRRYFAMCLRVALLTKNRLSKKFL